MKPVCFSILLFCALTLSLFIACGSGNSDDDDDDAADDDDDDDNGDDDDDGDDDDEVEFEIDQYGITWIVVPAGTYEMGCSLNDAQCNSDESPRHTVSISSYKMMATEMTEAYHQAITGDVYNSWNAENCGMNCPLFSIPWAVAAEVCYQAGRRLPSEAEWEYAARAGTTTRYYCDDDPVCLDDIAWYNDNQPGTGHQPSSGKMPNDWGFYDILGTRLEWTADWYRDDYYSNSPVNDPPGPSVSTTRVMRGGSWSDLGSSLRVSNRWSVTPETYYYNFGFRCAK